ncbi:MAG: ZIP family metal transporter [Candidatus Magasanikbacteria bacterium]|nr:ZIP family metal transporter [Candidatus Magasanikbacteria bacterium]
MLLQIIFWTILIGFIGVGGAFVFLKIFSKKEEHLLLVVSFAAGALVGVSFLELLPEALETGVGSGEILGATLLGFVFFYVMGRFLIWHHCHDEHCTARASASLIIIGDTLHNFLDGMVIAASFLVGAPLGIMTALAIIFHEIPQEVGDFGVLLHSGYTRSRALLMNGVSAVFAVLGGIIGFYFFESFRGFLPYLLAMTAGGFLYLGASDLLPQTHESAKRASIFKFTISFLAGIIVLLVLGLIIKE